MEILNRRNIMSTSTPFDQESDIYRLFFENIPNAVLINQMIYNEKEEAVDFVILDVNHVVEKYVGVKREDIIGRKIRDIDPNFEQALLTLYDDVISSSVSQRFERYYDFLNRWFGVYVFPLCF